VAYDLSGRVDPGPGLAIGARRKSHAIAVGTKFVLNVAGYPSSAKIPGKVDMDQTWKSGSSIRGRI
jgi:hypothetical protein